jgi:hypothetical protein
MICWARSGRRVIGRLDDTTLLQIIIIIIIIIMVVLLWPWSWQNYNYYIIIIVTRNWVSGIRQLVYWVSTNR